MKFGNITLMAGAQIKNLRGEKLATDPDVGTLVANQEAMLWYNTTEKVYKFFNGTEILPLGAGGDVDLSGLVKADGTVAMTADLELSSADQSASDDKAAVSKGHVNTLLASKLSVSGGALTADLSAGGFGISNLGAPVQPTDAARKVDIENALSGLNWKEDIDALQTDDVLQPQKVDGKRYVLTNVASLHADFGTIDGAVNNVIVEYATDEFVVVFSPTEERAEGAIAWNSATNQYVRFDGSAWSTFGGMASVTAGAGLTQTGNEISVDLDEAGGLGINAEGVTLKLDGSTLALSATGVKIADGGVGYAQISAAALGEGLTRNTTTSKIEINKQSLKDGGFIDGNGGEVEALILTGEMADDDNAVPNRKFVTDADAKNAKAYIYDGTADAANTTFTFTHNAGQRFGSVIVCDETGAQIIPDSVVFTDANTINVTVAEAIKPFIAFVAGANQFVKNEAPVDTYSILLAQGSASRYESQYSTLAMITGTGLENIKSVAWTRDCAQMPNAQNLMGASSLVFRLYNPSTPVWPVVGTVTATITKKDDTQVVVTEDINITEMPSLVRLGTKQTASDTSQTTSSYQIKPGETIGISIVDDGGNVLRGADGAGATNMALKSGETITEVSWGIEGNIANSTGYRGDDLQFIRGTHPYRANLYMPPRDDATIASGTTLSIVIYATLKTSMDRTLIAPATAMILKSDNALTTKAAFAYTQAQLDAAVLN